MASKTSNPNYDASTANDLTDHYVMKASMLDTMEREFNVPQEHIWETLTTAYTNLTGVPVSPTPTHREREEFFHAHFRLGEWLEMTDEERDVYTNTLMACLYEGGECERCGELHPGKASQRFCLDCGVEHAQEYLQNKNEEETSGWS